MANTERPKQPTAEDIIAAEERAAVAAEKARVEREAIEAQAQADREAILEASETRRRLAAMVDIVRSHATQEEQKQVIDLLRPIVQQVNSRL